jgi:hypothetical protein
MDKKDIDKLLICREAIDKHRAFNKARVEALETATSIDEAKTIIESKIGKVTSIKKDETLKSKQDIKNILEEERTKSTLEINQILKEQGFIDDEGNGSTIVFGKWNEVCCVEVYKECHPLQGTCDFCGEETLLNQKCVQMNNLMSVASCSAVKNNDFLLKGTDEEILFKMYSYLLIFERKGVPYTTESINKYFCPAGHGYYVDESKLKVLPFDVCWRV